MSKVEGPDPLPIFLRLMEQAERSEPDVPTAAALATCDAGGAPSVRMVLIRGVDERGFVFYTNLESRKGHELRSNPRAALCVHWKSLTRQVRIEGGVEAVSDEEGDAYFASRDRSSQIGAWASRQSEPMSGRFELEKQVARYAARFGLGRIPRPEFWSGFRLRPQRIEFWKQGAFRLHERTLYVRSGDGWLVETLFP